MFLTTVVNAGNRGKAFRLDSIVGLEITGNVPSVALQVILCSGNVDSLGVYPTVAEAQSALSNVLERLGWIGPEGILT